jgi:hypothetical protein
MGRPPPPRLSYVAWSKLWRARGGRPPPRQRPRQQVLRGRRERARVGALAVRALVADLPMTAMPVLSSGQTVRQAGPTFRALGHDDHDPRRRGRHPRPSPGAPRRRRGPARGLGRGAGGRGGGGARRAQRRPWPRLWRPSGEPPPRAPGRLGRRRPDGCGGGGRDAGLRRPAGRRVPRSAGRGDAAPPPRSPGRRRHHGGASGAARVDGRPSPALFAWARDTGAPLVHYKACSTLDSAPGAGSIGRALELGLAATGAASAPMLFAAPEFGRFQAFGHLFAAGLGGVHRLDRHPVMARHPVTPMDESDVCRHLARQTDLPLAALHRTALTARGYAALVAAGARGVALDCAGEDDLAAAGALLWAAPGFVVGSQGIETALLAHWRARGWIGVAPEAQPPSLVSRVAVVSGSASITTARQIALAEAQGWPVIPLDAAALFGPGGGAAVTAAADGRPRSALAREKPHRRRRPRPRRPRAGLRPRGHGGGGPLGGRGRGPDRRGAGSGPRDPPRLAPCHPGPRLPRPDPRRGLRRRHFGPRDPRPGPQGAGAAGLDRPRRLADAGAPGGRHPRSRSSSRAGRWAPRTCSRAP